MEMGLKWGQQYDRLTRFADFYWVALMARKIVIAYLSIRRFADESGSTPQNGVATRFGKEIAVENRLGFRRIRLGFETELP